MYKKFNFMIEADNLKIDSDNLNIFYKNKNVRTFLEDNDKFCILSGKGYGKTLLLKIKRKNIEKDGMHCLPSNEVMLDVPTEIRFNKELANYMKDYNNWKVLWQVAICLSVIRYAKDRFENEYKENIDYLDDIFKELIYQNNNITPCEYFVYLLSTRRKYLNTLLTKVHEIISVYNKINFQMAIFIDSVDEALKLCIYKQNGLTKSSHGTIDADFWYFSQHGLVEAIGQLSKKSKHIKIYCSARQEAFFYTERLTDLKQQLRSYTVELKYSFDDMRNMFDLYIQNIDEKYLTTPELKYENPQKAFVGFDIVKHTYTDETEILFDYIYRHSLKRPRDIMDICLAISEINENKDIDKFKVAVNTRSHRIVREYLEVADPFLHNLDQEEIIDLFSIIYTNVLDRKSLIDLCSQFNKINRFCSIINCVSCSEKHPFCNLYNIGLLGYIEEVHALKKHKQSFVEPGHSEQYNNNILPKSEIYLLHPSLNDYLQQIRSRNNGDFNYAQDIIVGDNREYIDYDTKQILTRKNIFVSSTGYDLKDLRSEIKPFLHEKGFKKVYCYEYPDFPVHEPIHTHDNCIEVVKKADIYIQIIDGRYGGKYSGSLYKNVIDEISTKYSQDICISWAEFVQAKNLNKRIIIFVRDSVWDEKPIYELNKKRGLEIETYHTDKRVFKFIDYMNKNINNNWIYQFRDLSELKVKLEKILLYKE